VLCATDFKSSFVVPFVAERLERLCREIAVLARVLHGQRQISEKTRLLEIMRSYIPKIQVESEGYFLERFKMNGVGSKHAFFGRRLSAQHISERDLWREND
jgi:hypothetical protein